MTGTLHTPPRYRLVPDTIRHAVYRAEHEAGAVMADAGYIEWAKAGQTREYSGDYSRPRSELAEQYARLKAATARIAPEYLGHAWPVLEFGRGRQGGGVYWSSHSSVAGRPLLRVQPLLVKERASLRTLTHEFAHHLDAYGAGAQGHSRTFCAAHCAAWSIVYGSARTLRAAYEAAKLPVATADELCANGRDVFARLVRHYGEV